MLTIQATLSQEYMMYLIAASGVEMDDAQAHSTVVQLLEAVKLLQAQAQQEVK